MSLGLLLSLLTFSEKINQSSRVKKVELRPHWSTDSQFWVCLHSIFDFTSLQAQFQFSNRKTQETKIKNYGPKLTWKSNQMMDGDDKYNNKQFKSVCYDLWAILTRFLVGLQKFANQALKIILRLFQENWKSGSKLPVDVKSKDPKIFIEEHVWKEAVGWKKIVSLLSWKSKTGPQMRLSFLSIARHQTKVGSYLLASTILQVNQVERNSICLVKG